MLIETVSAVLGQIQGGTLKALAVTGKDRFPAVPDVPAAIEFGVLPGYDVTTWYGVFGPPGMPAPIVAKLNKTLIDAIADDKVRDRMVAAGVVVKGTSAADFGAFMTSEYKRWDECAWQRGLRSSSPVTLRRPRGDPRRATAEALRPCVLRGSIHSHLRMTDHDRSRRWTRKNCMTAG